MGDERRFAKAPTRYVFGRIDQKTVAITTRFNYTMTPTLSLQVYAEPFVSAGDYSNYKELVDGRAEQYEDRYQPYAYGSNADFNIRSFRTTNVLRWEYRPGSQLFLVWQQNNRTTRLRRFPLRPGFRRRLFSALAQRLPGEVQLLAEYVDRPRSPVTIRSVSLARQHSRLLPRRRLRSIRT